MKSWLKNFNKLSSSFTLENKKLKNRRVKKINLKLWKFSCRRLKTNNQNKRVYKYININSMII